MIPITWVLGYLLLLLLVDIVTGKTSSLRTQLLLTGVFALCYSLATSEHPKAKPINPVTIQTEKRIQT